MIKFLKRESNLVEVRGTIKSIRIEKDAFLLKIVSDDLLGLANYNDIDFNELHQKYSRGEFFTTNINPIFLQTIYKLYKKGKSCFFTFKGLNITAVELEEYAFKDSIIVTKEESNEKMEEIKNFVKEVEHETENIPEISQTTLITESIDEISVEKYQEQIDLNEIQAISEEFKEEITPVAMARPSKELLVSEFQDTAKITTLDELESELSTLAEADISIEDEAVQEAVIDEEIKEEENEVETLEAVQEAVIDEEIKEEENEVETLEAVQEAVIDEEIKEEKAEVETIETLQEAVIDEEIKEEKAEVETIETVKEAVIDEEIKEDKAEVETIETVQEAVIDEEIKEDKLWPKVEYLIQNEEIVKDELETTTALPENIDVTEESIESIDEGREVDEEIVEELILNESVSETKQEIKEESIINNLDTIEDELPEELSKTDLIQEKLDELTELNEYEALKEEILKKDSETEISNIQNNIDIEEEEQTARVLDTLSSFSNIMESLDSLNELSKEIDKMENELKEYDLPQEQENNNEEEFDVDLDEKSEDFNTEEIPEEILNELENASSPIVEEFDTIEEENLSEIDKLSIEIEDVDTLEEIELQKLETPEETKEVQAEKEDKKSIEDEISDFEDELPTKIF